jgi:Transposase, Mutator family
VWLDATYLKARQDGQVLSTAVVIAIGLNAQSGQREVLGLDVGPSEDGAFWLTFLRSLVGRGLSGVCGWSPATPTRASRAPWKPSCRERTGRGVEFIS